MFFLIRFIPSCLTHLSLQTLFLRLQLTEGALELFQLTLKTWNFPLSQELLLFLHI